MDQRGFTLLELLIAMTLMGLVAVMLTGSLRFGTRIWESALERRDEIADQRTAYAFLRRLMTRLVPQNLSQEATAQTVTFLGTADRMRMLGPAPAQAARPGLYRIEVAVENVGGGRRDLVVLWQSSAGDLITAPLDDADRRTLLSDVGNATFSYLGSRDEGWIGRWTDRVDLPQLVRLSLGRARGIFTFEDVVFGTQLGVPEIAVSAGG